MPPAHVLLTHVQRPLRWALAASLLLAPALPLHAQGCAQCLDSTRATPPAVQAAYRHAIYLLGGAGLTLFLTGSLLLRDKHSDREAAEDSAAEARGNQR